MTGFLIFAAAVVWITIGLATTRWVAAPWMAREYPLSWQAGELRVDATVFGLLFWPVVLLFGSVVFVCKRLAAWVIDEGDAS